MAKDDYLPPTTSSALRLKGAKDSGITKTKKKKKAKPPVSPSPTTTTTQEAGNTTLDTGTEAAEERAKGRAAEGASTTKERGVNPLQEGGGSEREMEGEGGMEGEEAAHVYKTDAERRHQEMRRKRLDERLKREGVKTHKERVEELNRYLSNLSEHHDMPRIGPG